MDRAEWVSEAHVSDQYDTGGDPDGERIYDLGATERDALIAAAVLRDDAPSGADVVDEIEARYGADVHTSTVYYALQSLHERGLVMTNQLNGRTKAFRPTGAGISLLKGHVARVADAAAGSGPEGRA